MKLLLDFLPLILFFATFKYGTSHPEWAAEWANRALGSMTSGGAVPADQAPMLLATAGAILATAAVIVVLKARGRKVDLVLWITLGVLIVLGGLTIWLHDERFIKFKPTGVYWVLGLLYWGSQALWGKNILKAAVGEQLPLPEAIWQKLNVAWIVFFVLLGALNLLVAYTVDTPTWVNFKVFGTTALSLLFVVGQGFYINKYLPTEAPNAPGDGP